VRKPTAAVYVIVDGREVAGASADAGAGAGVRGGEVSRDRRRQRKRERMGSEVLYSVGVRDMGRYIGSLGGEDEDGCVCESVVDDSE